MIEKLIDKFPEYAMRIQRMSAHGYEYEEILATVRDLSDSDYDEPDIAPPYY